MPAPSFSIASLDLSLFLLDRVILFAFASIAVASVLPSAKMKRTTAALVLSLVIGFHSFFPGSTPGGRRLGQICSDRRKLDGRRRQLGPSLDKDVNATFFSVRYRPFFPWFLSTKDPEATEKKLEPRPHPPTISSKGTSGAGGIEFDVLGRGNGENFDALRSLCLNFYPKSAVQANDHIVIGESAFDFTAMDNKIDKGKDEFISQIDRLIFTVTFLREVQRIDVTPLLVVGGDPGTFWDDLLNSRIYPIAVKHNFFICQIEHVSLNETLADLDALKSDGETLRQRRKRERLEEVARGECIYN